MEEKNDQDVSSIENTRLEFTDTGYIHNIKDECAALGYYFGKATKNKTLS